VRQTFVCGSGFFLRNDFIRCDSVGLKYLSFFRQFFNISVYLRNGCVFLYTNLKEPLLCVQDLQPLFDKYGDVGDIYIPTERGTGRSRGFAFVRYYDKRDAEVN